MGGYEIFGKYDTVRKEYSGLPAHTGILITFKTYFIDKFDNNERLWLKLKDDP